MRTAAAPSVVARRSPARGTVVLEAVVRRLASSWAREAEARKQVSAHDTQADTLRYCAKELEQQLEEALAPGQMLSVAEHARTVAGKSRNRVPGWIRRGALAAVPTPAGFRVPVGARRRQPKRER